MSLEAEAIRTGDLEVERPSAFSRYAAGARANPGDAVRNGLAQIMLVIWAAMVVLPFLWMILTSLKTDSEIISSPWDLPASLQWDNFERAWTDARIGRFFLNTIIVLTGSITGTLIVSAMAAYVLARFVFPGRQVIFFAFAAGLMFPVFLGLVPLYFLVDDLSVIGLGLATYQTLIVVYIAYSLPFTIFFLTAFFKTLPSELGEAAILDGASQYQVFFQIMLPLAKPGLIAMGIFNFLGHWNQFLLPLVLMPETLSGNKMMLSQGLYFLAIQGTYDNDYGALFAAMVITMVPTLVVYILFQRRLEAGLTAGALKG